MKEKKKSNNNGNDKSTNVSRNRTANKIYIFSQTTLIVIYIKGQVKGENITNYQNLVLTYFKLNS